MWVITLISRCCVIIHVYAPIICGIRVSLGLTCSEDHYLIAGISSPSTTVPHDEQGRHPIAEGLDILFNEDWGALPLALHLGEASRLDGCGSGSWSAFLFLLIRILMSSLKILRTMLWQGEIVYVIIIVHGADLKPFFQYFFVSSEMARCGCGK